MTPFPMADWANFFVAEVGAAAALTGLLFVAISINLATILKFEHLPGRAAETLFVLVGALILGSIGLMPNLSPRTLGIAVLCVGLCMCVFPGWIQVRSGPLTKREVEERRRILRIALSWLPSLLVITGAVLLLRGDADGLYWVAAGMVAALVAGIVNAWVLLVEILR